MDYSEVLIQARKNSKLCEVCPNCNGFACAGQLPGVGGKGSGASFQRNYNKLREIVLKMDTISSNLEVNSETTLFNKKLAFPLLAAPIAGIATNFGIEMSEEEYTEALMEGCSEAGIIAFSGDGKFINMFLDPLSILNKYDNGICTIKPWVMEGIKQRIVPANDSSAIAIACDIDAAGLDVLRDSAIPVEFKSETKLKEMIDLSNKPFIVKGIVSLAGATKAYQAGASAIVLSNHGGRVLDECICGIEVLEEVADMYKDKMTILVDGGFRSGADIFKALALGAHGVLIGRPISISIIGGGKEGLSLYLTKLKNELKACMVMCGCTKIEDICKDKITK